jgi:hypothetical protein
MALTLSVDSAEVASEPCGQSLHSVPSTILGWFKLWVTSGPPQIPFVVYRQTLAISIKFLVQRLISRTELELVVLQPRLVLGAQIIEFRSI